ncbi:MAG: hypothetical protein ABSE15_00130 [Candidatus Bathyarchaeia archaeon]|jgi:hypothetical protein
MVEKKVVLCAVLAIAIGIATIIPMEYLMAAQAQANAHQTYGTYGNPWFNVNVPYAYYIANETNHGASISYGEGYYIALNITTNPDAIKPIPDARIEYYLIQVYSDQGPIENFTYAISANCTGTVNPYIQLDSFYNYWVNASLPPNLFNDNKVLLFLPNFDGTLPATLPATYNAWQGEPTYTLTAKNQAISGFSESFWNGQFIKGINMTSTNSIVNSLTNQTLEQIQDIQNAQSITISISRIGYVTVDGDSTTATPASGVIQQIQLTPYNGGFLYNTIIPQDLVSQTDLQSPIFP